MLLCTNSFERMDRTQLLSYPCNSKRERDLKEREFIELLKPSLNCSLPICTDDERITYSSDYKKKHKVYISEYRKQNYVNADLLLKSMTFADIMAHLHLK